MNFPAYVSWLKEKNIRYLHYFDFPTFMRWITEGNADEIR